MKYLTVILCFVLFLSCNTSQNISTSTEVENTLAIEYPSGHYNEVLDGRMILMLSDHKDTE